LMANEAGYSLMQDARQVMRSAELPSAIIK
jgi:hypothetical protein